jgi:ribose-phosphate pyrophosphokinase
VTKIVFATAAYADLGQKLAHLLGAESGAVERKAFPDQERYLRILSPPSGHHVLLVGGTISDFDTLEIFDLGCGLVREGAQSLTLVVPYFAYSTMERASKPGEVVTAKTRARLLSAIPRARAGNRALLLEVHSEGLPHYFDGDLMASQVAADAVIVAAARREGGDDFVIGSADAGRAKRVQGLANLLGVPAGFVMKRRIDDRTTELVAMAANVAGRHVIIYDDMIRTGSSLLSAARAYLDAGAAGVTALTTHGVLPGDALAVLKESGAVRRVVCTDSHPHARELADGDFLRVDSIAEVLADALRAMP